MRAKVCFGVVAALAGLAGCRTEPVQRLVTIEVRVDGCGVDCGTPGSPITTANRGDTVWVFLGVRDSLSGDSSLVTIRADCDVNVEIENVTGLVTTLPAVPTCPGSTVQRYVGVSPNVVIRYFQWVIDPALPAGSYIVRGTALLDPLLIVEAVLPVQ